MGQEELRPTRQQSRHIVDQGSLRRHKTYGRGKVGLAHARGTQEDHVFCVFQKAHGGQLINLTLVNRGLEGEVKPDIWICFS